MSIFYRILGIAASINEWLSRKSINFIQLNWLLMAFFGFGVYNGIITVIELASTSSVPEKISITQVKESYEKNKKFVTVSGIYAYEYSVEYGSRKKDSIKLNVTSVYVPLFDIVQNKAVFIKDRPGINFNEKPVEKEFTGMIELVPEAVSNELKKSKSDTVIEPLYAINPESKPPTKVGTIIGLVFFTIPAFAFFYTWFKRYTVIQENNEKVIVQKSNLDQFSKFESDQEITNETTTHVDGNLTGDLFFSKGGKQRFFNMPTRINFMEDGSILCASNIDASSTFFGFKTNDKEGIWTTVIRKGDVQEIRNIFQYNGFKKRKGIQIIGTSSNENKELVLSFENDKDHKEAYSFASSLK
ncbi:MAG: hypothetical protein SFU98_22710 [Leptospiraceae bacterium]|nr:hypothetical protein [Leptospiraceae bacterium]